MTASAAKNTAKQNTARQSGKNEMESFRSGERAVVFDAGTIISLTTNNLLWILEPLKKRFGGKLYITPAVRYELIEKPLNIKRFEFEGIQVLQLVHSGVLEVIDDSIINERAISLLSLANNIFMAKENWINIVHIGEIEALAAARHFSADLFAVDERTTRLLIEDPFKLHKILEHELKTNVSINKINLEAFREKTKNIKVVRSTEIATIAFKAGLLDKYLLSDKSLSKAKEQLLDSVLWGLKLRGCSISEKEIDEIVKMES